MELIFPGLAVFIYQVIVMLIGQMIQMTENQPLVLVFFLEIT